ncbi:PTS sugar transporter subunit IIA, partial [candidate division WOR-3 bacterium]|nr:PTS sugar transporter subunit IIA [candidate division WOR-3 bacterium]
MRPEPMSEPEPSSARLPRTRQAAMRPEFVLDLDAPSPREVFRLVAERLAQAGVLAEPDALAAALEKREQAGSTGVGHGIALPHVMLPGLDRIVVAVVRLESPLEWDAVDGEPVRLLVVILAPAEKRDEYLKVLAEVARQLNQPVVRDRAVAARAAAAAARVISQPPREGFLRRNRRLLIFGAATALVFVAARIALARVVLPETGIYAAAEYAKFNEPRWLFYQELTVTLFLA